jgi:16S rRNA processing protein RimM
LGGEVLVKVLSQNPTRFGSGAELLVGKDPDSADLIEVAGSRMEGGRLLVRFAKSSSVEVAETLRDLLIFVPKEALDQLGEDEFWAHDLVGLTVVDTGGVVLGTLDQVIDRPAQDLWSIKTDKGDVLFPAAKPLVLSVDLEGGTIVVDPPQGLFD